MGRRQASRPQHLVTRDQVGSWLADSVVKTVTYHSTTPDSAADIIAHGVSIDRSVRGAFGQGFYSTTNPDLFHGSAIVAVAIKTRSPLVGALTDIEMVIDAIAREAAPQARGLTPVIAAAVRRELLHRGYDGIIVRDGGGDGVDYIIAITAESVRVVHDP